MQLVMGIDLRRNVHTVTPIEKAQMLSVVNTITAMKAFVLNCGRNQFRSRNPKILVGLFAC